MRKNKKTTKKRKVKNNDLYRVKKILHKMSEVKENGTIRLTAEEVYYVLHFIWSIMKLACLEKMFGI